MLWIGQDTSPSMRLELPQAVGEKAKTPTLKFPGAWQMFKASRNRTNDECSRGPRFPLCILCRICGIVNSWGNRAVVDSSSLSVCVAGGRHKTRVIACTRQSAITPRKLDMRNRRQPVVRVPSGVRGLQRRQRARIVFHGSRRLYFDVH